MIHNHKKQRIAAMLLALMLLTLHCTTALAASPASGTDTSSGDVAVSTVDVSNSDTSSTDVSGSDTSNSDVSSTDAPVDLHLGTVKAKAALLVDMNTLEVLYEQDADQPLPPASTTKIMTALLVMEAIDRGELSLDESIVADSKELESIPWDASTINPRIATGEILTVRDYLYCVMLSSDCAACNVLAKRVSGSVDAFIELMNTRAQELGCSDVNFLNTHGYPKEGHTATARSMYLITQAAMNYPDFAEIVSARSYTIPATNKNADRRLANTNGLMVGSSEYNYLYATGVKTGYSKSSGYCLVSTAEKSGRSLLAVVLGAEKVPNEDGKMIYEHFTESKRLLEWGFNAFTWQTIATAGFSASEVPLYEGELNYLTLVYADSAVALLPVDFNMDTLERKVELVRSSATAPVMKGESFGTVRILRDGVELAAIPLVAGADAPVKEVMDPTIIYVVAGGAVLALICLVMAIKQARSRHSGYGYDPIPDPASDPNTYRYGERPLYKRRRHNGPVARPTYSDGGYYTHTPEPEDEYEEYRRELERERRQRSQRDYYEPPQPQQPGPIFPRNWTPPGGRK